MGVSLYEWRRHGSYQSEEVNPEDALAVDTVHILPIMAADIKTPVDYVRSIVQLGYLGY